jgi:hypothetical protein
VAGPPPHPLSDQGVLPEPGQMCRRSNLTEVSCLRECTSRALMMTRTEPAIWPLAAIDAAEWSKPTSFGVQEGHST